MGIEGERHREVNLLGAEISCHRGKERRLCSIAQLRSQFLCFLEWLGLPTPQSQYFTDTQVNAPWIIV